MGEDKNDERQRYLDDMKKRAKDMPEFGHHVEETKSEPLRSVKVELSKDKESKKQ